ncbi:3TM-type holin [Dawidia soli]|uniref:Holin of 3TMs, for gene-transfer release n=1 Tax=Dawidia soli TaxID=2782352 RepID=A0AAP2DBI2_9BACT|nr:3TM-type holin [Dawidia soli]MBT1688903.1 hypothetical protein [Dawidia soli]
MSNFIGKILGRGAKETIEAIGNTIDKIDKSDEKLSLQLRYKELILEMEGAYLAYEGKLLESQSKIVESETKGESWLQRNWRPSLMVMCMFIVFNNYVLVPYFGMPTTVLDDHIWLLIEMGVTGYVAGRSLEKITDKLAPVLATTKKKV